MLWIVVSRFSLAVSSSCLIRETPRTTFSYEDNADPAAADRPTGNELLRVWAVDFSDLIFDRTPSPLQVNMMWSEHIVARPLAASSYRDC